MSKADPFHGMSRKGLWCCSCPLGGGIARRARPWVKTPHRLLFCCGSCWSSPWAVDAGRRRRQCRGRGAVVFGPRPRVTWAISTVSIQWGSAAVHTRPYGWWSGNTQSWWAARVSCWLAGRSLSVPSVSGQELFLRRRVVFCGGWQGCVPNPEACTKMLPPKVPDSIPFWHWSFGYHWICWITWPKPQSRSHGGLICEEPSLVLGPKWPSQY